MNNNVTINVIAGAGVGKSTIAQIVSECLQEYGFTVNHQPETHAGERGDTDKFRNLREDAVKEHAVITIKEIQSRLPPA